MDTLQSKLKTVLSSITPKPRRLLVAFSGGIDSMVLLHSLATLDYPGIDNIVALHVNHGLQTDSPNWVSHCREQCKELGIDFLSTSVDITQYSGEGLEDKARNARYHWFASVCSDDDVVLTAHHLSDNAETVLYNLVRGAGTRGLSGIQATRAMGEGRLLRPFIDVTKAEILDYAATHSLACVEDPSNQDVRFDRNFLRTDILPRLQSRWPAASRGIVRSAENAYEAQVLADELAEIDLSACLAKITFYPVDENAVLRVDRLQRLSRVRIKNLLRFWLWICNAAPLSRARQDYVIRHLLGDGLHGSFRWANCQMHRYRDHLFLQIGSIAIENLRLQWNLQHPLPLGETGLVLSTGQSTGPIEVEVTLGNQARAFKRSESSNPRSLKKLFQAASVPVFLRPLLPVVSRKDVTLAIPGVFVSEDFRDQNGSPITLNLARQ